MIRFAFGSVPKDAGTFTFYRNLRPALLAHEIDLRCVAVGRAQADLWDPRYADDGCVLLAPQTRDVKKQAQAFAAWCEQEQVDVVMGINSEAILSALPHLPERIRVLARCAGGFDHGYRITMSGRERLARIVATTPRLANDLVAYYGADPARMCLIPNGIAPEPFEEPAHTPRGQKEKLRLGFLGRLEHTHKGVLHLPQIVRELNARQIPFDFMIAGKGKLHATLEKEMQAEIKNGQVKLLGAIPPAQVPQFLADTDIFIFPSHVEGCPNALLEALMAGCVSVSWLLPGITDFVVEDGRTGFICPVGDYACVAQHVQVLAADRVRLKMMSAAIASAARERFTNQKAAAAYAALIKEVLAQPPPAWTPTPWNQFKGDPNFEHGWKEYIKGWREWAEDLAALFWRK